MHKMQYNHIKLSNNYLKKFIVTVVIYPHRNRIITIITALNNKLQIYFDNICKKQ